VAHMSADHVDTELGADSWTADFALEAATLPAFSPHDDIDVVEDPRASKSGPVPDSLAGRPTRELPALLRKLLGPLQVAPAASASRPGAHASGGRSEALGRVLV